MKATTKRKMPESSTIEHESVGDEVAQCSGIGTTSSTLKSLACENQQSVLFSSFEASNDVTDQAVDDSTRIGLLPKPQRWLNITRNIGRWIERKIDVLEYPGGPGQDKSNGTAQERIQRYKYSGL